MGGAPITRANRSASAERDSPTSRASSSTFQSRATLRCLSAKARATTGSCNPCFQAIFGSLITAQQSLRVQRALGTLR